MSDLCYSSEDGSVLLSEESHRLPSPPSSACPSDPVDVGNLKGIKENIIIIVIFNLVLPLMEGNHS